MKYPTARDLLEAIEHCSRCGECNPDETGDGESACCGARVCRPDGDAQGVCCAAVQQRMDEEAATGTPARPAAPPAARPAARETGGLQSGSGDANLVSHTGGTAPTPEDTEEPAMATTRYSVAATPSHPEAKIISNLKSARAEADARAKTDRVDVEVTTVATGKLTYTAKGAPLAPAPAAAPVPAPVEDDAQDAPAPAPAKAAKKATPVTRKVRRATLGPASVDGWELLYDKPKQGCEVGRDAAGQYALICKTHKHVHPVTRLTQERTIRANGGWCPECVAAK